MADPRLQFVRYLVAWLVATLLVLVALDRFSLVQYYVLSIVGCYLVTEVAATETVSVTWRRRVRIVGLLLGIGFVVVVARQIQLIVAGGA